MKEVFTGVGRPDVASLLCLFSILEEFLFPCHGAQVLADPDFALLKGVQGIDMGTIGEGRKATYS